MRRIMTEQKIDDFRAYLVSDEKSRATVEKYLRDVNRFAEFCGRRAVSKALIVEYKAILLEKHTARSANSMIAALNSFLKFAGWHDCCIKQFRVQQQAFCQESRELTREEYMHLVRAAKEAGNERLYLIIQTICGTGIRVSELEYITVEAVRQGSVEVSCKGKLRRIFIVDDLRKKLTEYIKRKGIQEGPVFVTKSGKPVNRCNIWREMKALCELAGVAGTKVFPHNLRHLFAKAFYEVDKDIAKLADVLGHASINTTRIYIVETGEEHRKKMESMKLII